MIKNWLKSILSPKKIISPKNYEGQELIVLVDFLWKKIDTPGSAHNLKNRIAVFKELSLEKKIKAIPELYLLLEHHIVEKNNIKSDQHYIRGYIIEKCKSLFKYNNFKLIFNPLEEQELILCKVFLSKVLEKSSELVGTFNDPKIMEIKEYLDTSYNFGDIDLIKERKNLLEFSNQIYLRIKNSLGINAITNIYVLVYKEHFQSYQLLDSFTATLNVIPEEILAKDFITLPSKQQMHRMLQKQLYSLEEINERLTKEIIERKKVEEELKYSEHLKTTILETAMDGIILVNSEGIILNWNKQSEYILGLKKEETIGTSIYKKVPYKLKQQLKSSFSDYIETGYGELINKRVETSVTRQDNTIAHIELTIIAIEAKDDYLFNAFFRDITDRKNIDNEIREAKTHAEKSAKAKSVFLSNMSHEIRTPLNVILGLTGILQKSGFSQPDIDKKNLDGIQFSAENLLILINDILDFSKIEAGKLTLHNTDFDLRELIINISRGFKIKADEKGLQYAMHIDSSVPKFIVGDQLRLNQILVNLLGNAIKFTHEGEISIHVKAKKSIRKRITVTFSVKDTGVGIATDKLKNIFESFYQVHKPGKNKIEGTGLGLSISKQLIELQGGVLNAESKPGKGSVFEFSIVYTKSNFKSSKLGEKSASNTDNTQNLSNLKALIVEDNKMNQFFIKQVFTNWGIESHIADNGKDALKKLEQHTYDLILMDMHMPIMDGPEAAKKIRKSTDSRINNIPIIACSADVFPESKKKALDSGMNFYLSKPLSEQTLEEILLNIASDTIVKNPTPTNTDNAEEKTNPVVDSEKFCDFTFLEKTFDNDKEIIKGILQIFIDETPGDYQMLQQAIDDKQGNAIKQAAHKLKSSFKTIGLQKEAVLLENIEQLSKNPSKYEILKVNFDQLHYSFPKIIQEIEESLLVL